MHSALRPYVTTGLALVGTSVIALAPLAPPNPAQGAATTSKQVTQEVTLSAKVITINPSPDALDITEQLGGSYCPSAGTCVALEYQPIWSSPGQFGYGVQALQEALAGNPGEDITVFGFSEGAVVASQWLAAHLADPVAYPAPENLTFVVIGNPSRKYGGSGAPWGSTWPGDSGFNVIDVTNQYDPTGDIPANPFNVLATLNASMGFFTKHLNNGYKDVDIDDPANSRWEEDGIEYVFVPSPTLPLLEPLRWFGLDELADDLDAPFRKIIERAYNRNENINLPAAEPSPSNIPINLLQMFANVPANMVAGTNRFAEAMRASGSWWVYSPVNVLGWDPANPEMIRGFVDFLLPIPSLSTPLGIAADYWARANLPMNEGCTGTGRAQCLDPDALTDQMFKVMFWDLFNPEGFTFTDPITPPVNPVSENEGYWGQELGEDGLPVEWYGETITLKPFAELASFWEYLNAPPEGIETPTLDDHLSAGRNLFEALMVTFYPFVPKSQIWNPNETAFAYLVRPFAKVLCPTCNEIDPFMPTDWKVGIDIPPTAYIPPSVKDKYDPETGKYIGPAIPGVTPDDYVAPDADDASATPSFLSALFSGEASETEETPEVTEQVSDETTDASTEESTEGETVETTDAISTAVQNMLDKFGKTPAGEEETPASEDVTEDVSDDAPAEEAQTPEAPADDAADEKGAEDKTETGKPGETKPSAGDKSSEAADGKDAAGSSTGGKHRKDDAGESKSESKSEAKSDTESESKSESKRESKKSEAKSDSGSGSDKKSSAGSNSGGGSDD